MKINKHDRYLDELCTSLKDDYDHIYTNLPLFSSKKRLIGEIDVMAIKDGMVDVFEVKCSYRISKAKKQLKKIKKIISLGNQFTRIRAFFYCGEAAKLEHLF